MGGSAGRRENRRVGRVRSRRWWWLGRESAAVPSGIMRREQWQLLPIHARRGGGLLGGRVR